MKANGLRLIVIISDGIRGHLNQSKGVAARLSKLAGAPYAACEVLELEIPKLRGIKRFRVRRRAAALAGGGKGAALGWLKFAEGENAERQIAQWMLERGIRCEGERQSSSVILLSAGTMAALYNLALARVYGCPCATIMTPGVIGAAPFDFAIVPEHDHPKDAPNVLTTLGAPNLVVREELELAGQALLIEHPPERGSRWAVLVGGDDKNYKISAEWIRKDIGEIFREAERSNANLYITTSRRTSPEAERELKRMAAGCENVRFLLTASEDPSNPVPAMLGACDEIFVTDDSVNMVSEAATAGHRAVLLRAERPGTLKKIFQAAARMMVSLGLLPAKVLWGAPRFDLTFGVFRDKGLLIGFDEWIQARRSGETPPDHPRDDFNEARRAAEWILRKLPDIKK